MLDISGKPGRCVVVLYKLPDKQGVEHTFIHKIARIQKPRVVSIAIDLAQGLDMDIPFMVVTSSTQNSTATIAAPTGSACASAARSRIAGNLPQNHATDPGGEHQKVVRYGISTNPETVFCAPEATMTWNPES